jgi:hypothetical protein
MYESAIELNKIMKPPLRDPQSLRHMLCEVKSIMELATEEDLVFAKFVDPDLSAGVYTILSRYCGNLNALEIAKLERMRKHFGNVIHEVKQIHRIPRPYQLAPKFGVELPQENLISTSGVSFSYPSVHAAGSRDLAHLIWRKYHNCLGDHGRYEIFNYANRVAMSRIHLGVHSLQDIREGIRLADILHSDPT